MRLKAKSTQVRLSGTACRFRWKLPWNTWWYHLLLPSTVPTYGNIVTRAFWMSLDLVGAVDCYVTRSQNVKPLPFHLWPELDSTVTPDSNVLRMHLLKSFRMPPRPFRCDRKLVGGGGGLGCDPVQAVVSMETPRMVPALNTNTLIFCCSQWQIEHSLTPRPGKIPYDGENQSGVNESNHTRKQLKPASARDSSDPGSYAFNTATSQAYATETSGRTGSRSPYIPESIHRRMTSSS